MSHLTTIKILIRDLDALDQAAQVLGGQLIKGQTKARWYGRWVGDTALPEGMAKDALDHCDHVIRFPGATYDVGVFQNGPGEYHIAYDYYSAGGLDKIVGQHAGRLIQEYAAAAATRQARRKGQRVTRRQTLDADGRPRILLEISR